MRPKLVTYLVRFGLAWTVLATTARADSPSFETTAIFPMNSKHNHASCVVQTKEGNLLAAWYAGSGERKSDDVVIEGAWLDPRGTHWGQKFLMADTPGYPDCNPSIFAPPDGSLWLFWPTILDHRWEGALSSSPAANTCGRGRPDPMVIGRRASCHTGRLRRRNAKSDRALERRGKGEVAGISGPARATVARRALPAIGLDASGPSGGASQRPLGFPVVFGHVRRLDHGHFRRPGSYLDHQPSPDRLR